MSLLPKRILHELVAEHGRSICDDPARCDELLRKACPRYQREVDVIVSALQLGVVNALQYAGAGEDWWQATDPLIRQLTTGGQMTDTEARMAVEAWAQALGLQFRNAPFVLPEGLDDIEREQQIQARQARIVGGWLGWRSGAAAGGAIATIYATVWLMKVRGPAHRSQGQPWDEENTAWLIALLAGVLAGVVLGGLVGWRLGRAHPILTAAVTGAVIGAGYGLWYHPLWASFFTGKVPVEYVLPVQLLLAGLVGVAMGCTLGMASEIGGQTLLSPRERGDE